LKRYNQFLADNAAGIAAFKAKQQAAFHEERRRWAAAGQAVTVEADASADESPAGAVPTGWTAITAEVAGNMWKVDAAKGKKVASGDRLAIIESMKMEIPVLATGAGVVAD